MRIFLYEHITGGGFLEDARMTSELVALASEGRAMCDALAADLAAIDGVEVTCLRDARMSSSKPVSHRYLDVQSAYERDAAFDRFAAEADWTVVIAPEIDGVLLKLATRVGAAGGRLLGGPLPFIQLATDKHATAEHLRKGGVSVPRGIPFRLGQPWPVDFPYPAIWKPLDGAGSFGIRRIENCRAPAPKCRPQLGRLEELRPRSSVGNALRGVPGSGNRPSTSATGTPRRAFPTALSGIAVSVAFLCGPAFCVSLPPCRQYLADDFRYLGGSLPLSPDLASRAMRLARRAVDLLPEPLGYLGVDLVLGADEGGSDDVVIEINPRLTTSYVGLRAACRQNLAEALLAIAAGRAYNLSFLHAPIEFSADGKLGGWAS
jgi:predicted ATP-grasp superfamily ATP-dependent carboligase